MDVLQQATTLGHQKLQKAERVRIHIERLTKCTTSVLPFAVSNRKLSSICFPSARRGLGTWRGACCRLFDWSKDTISGKVVRRRINAQFLGLAVTSMLSQALQQ